MAVYSRRNHRAHHRGSSRYKIFWPLIAMKKQQLEKFADRAIGVAIASLILVFGLPIGRIAKDQHLNQVVPHLVIFGFSFLMICLFWVAQSNIMDLITRPVLTKKIVWLSRLYFFFLVLLPLSSKLIANNPYLPASILLYSCNLLVISVLHLLLFNSALKIGFRNHRRLTDKIRLSLKKMAFAGPALYIISIGVSYINAYVSFIAIIAALCFYAFLLNKSVPLSASVNS